MTTVSTGGFSTRNDSIAYFDNNFVEWIGIIFMLIGLFAPLAYIQFSLQEKKKFTYFRQPNTRILLAHYHTVYYFHHHEPNHDIDLIHLREQRFLT